MFDILVLLSGFPVFDSVQVWNIWDIGLAGYSV
jgi:hypothetical protein